MSWKIDILIGLRGEYRRFLGLSKKSSTEGEAWTPAAELGNADDRGTLFHFTAIQVG